MLRKLLDSLHLLEVQESTQIYLKLRGGSTLITANNIEMQTKVGIMKMHHNTVGVKYLYRIENGHIYCYKLFGSTDEKLVLTLCAIFPLDSPLMVTIFEKMVKDDMFYEVTDAEILKSAELRVAIPGGPESILLDASTKKKIQDELNKEVKQVVYFETPYN